MPASRSGASSGRPITRTDAPGSFATIAGASLLLIITAPAPAATQGLPINTPSALSLALAENAIRTGYRRIEMTLLREGDTVEETGAPSLGLDLVPLVVPYGLTSKTTLFFGIPYQWRSLEANGSRETSAGVGDAFVQIKQQILAQNYLKGTTRLALFGRSSIPTGQTERDGEPLPPPLRLGSGVVNLSGLAVLTHVNDRIGVTGMAGYTLATAASGGVRQGDRFQYGLALGYRLVPSRYRSFRDRTWVVYLEFNGTVEASATRASIALENTGGHILFVSPGLQFIPTPAVLFEATFQHPLVRELRGDQLGPDWSFGIGGRFNMYLLGR